MMKLTISVEYNELELDIERSCYNHLYYKFKNPKSGYTHLLEKYDDVCETPEYFFTNSDGTRALYGYGDAIDQSKFGKGGVFLDIQIVHWNTVQ